MGEVWDQVFAILQEKGEKRQVSKLSLCTMILDSSPNLPRNFDKKLKESGH